MSKYFKNIYLKKIKLNKLSIYVSVHLTSNTFIQHCINILHNIKLILFIINIFIPIIKYYISFGIVKLTNDKQIKKLSKCSKNGHCRASVGSHHFLY